MNLRIGILLSCCIASFLLTGCDPSNKPSASTAKRPSDAPPRENGVPNQPVPRPQPIAESVPQPAVVTLHFLIDAGQVSERIRLELDQEVVDVQLDEQRPVHSVQITVMASAEHKLRIRSEAILDSGYSIVAEGSWTVRAANAGSYLLSWAETPAPPHYRVGVKLDPVSEEDWSQISTTIQERRQLAAQGRSARRREADIARAQEEADAERRRMKVLEIQLDIQRTINRSHQIQMDAMRDYLKKAGY